MTHIARRRFATAAVVFVVVAVAGCSGGDTTDPATDSASSPGAELTIDSAPSPESATSPSTEATRSVGAEGETSEGAEGETADATPTPLPTPTASAGDDPNQQPEGVDGESLPDGDPDETPDGEVGPRGPAVVDVVARLGHDPEAFTQGLEFDQGRLYESRGLEGESALTEIDPTTGEVLRSVDLPDDVFGEGLTVVGDRVIVLTYRNERAFVFDVDSFEQVDEYAYQGEGWGICLDDDRLVMSNGSATLTHRDPDTFEVIGSVEVNADGQPVSRLNELECVDGLVWANVWQTDSIVVIDPDSGEVVSTIDASGLLRRGEIDDADVLNGIAYDPDGDRWIITGKWWPAMFEVEFVAR